MTQIVRTGKASNGTEHQDTYTYNYVGDLLTERTAASAQKGLAYTARYEYNGLRQAVKVYNSYDSLGNVITVSETDQETVVTKTDPLLQIPPDPTPDLELELYSITLPGGSGGGGDSGSGDSGSVQPDSTELVPVYAKNYAYDLAGNRVYFQLSINGNAVENINYNYDALNRLIQVVGSGALQAAYTYDVNGNRATLTNGNGITTNYEYNLANWVTSMSAGKRGETLFDYSYAYYASGTQKSKTDIAGKTTSYVYDGLGRLTQESESGGTTLTYVYDRNSNRVQMRATGAESYVVNYTYDEANRLLSETGGKNGSATVTSYTYDGNGSLLTQASTSPSGISTASYSYDAFGRQTRASINGTVALYSYNAQGLRTGKTVGEQNTSFLLDGDNIVAETRGSSLVSRYVYGVNLVSCRSGSSLLYYHQNAHGDVVKITTAAGAVNRSYDYDAFGNEKDPASADANPFRYCGEYWDSETETYYLRARYYDPGIGRFTQQDTHWNTANMIYGDNPQKINERQDALGLTAYTYVPQISAIMQSGNLYVYCVNSPVAYRDSTGEALINAICAAIGALAGWAFGDFVAKNLGLEGWKYWTVRAAVTVGGGAIGWFAGSAITSAVSSFLTANPAKMLSLAHSLGPSVFSTAMKFLGINPALLINDSGKFYGLLQTAFNTPHVQIGYEWAKALIQKAQQFGISVRLDAPHNNNWNVWHLNIGKYHVAINSQIIDAIKKLLEGK